MHFLYFLATTVHLLCILQRTLYYSTTVYSRCILQHTTTHYIALYFGEIHCDLLNYSALYCIALKGTVLVHYSPVRPLLVTFSPQSHSAAGLHQATEEKKQLLNKHLKPWHSTYNRDICQNWENLSGVGGQSCEMSQIWKIYLCKNIGRLG